METKRDLEQKAKSQIDSNPDEAVRLYKELIEAFPDEFNEWDALYAVKAIRGCQIPDLSWAKQLVEKFREEKVGNIYGWLIFDHCVKGKQRAEMIQNEAYILSLPEFSPQKDLRTDSAYPCPTTISIFKLADAFGENIFNAKKINQLLSLLDYNFLSDETKTIHVEKRGEIELASDLEKYFALKTKALIKLEQFKECKELCEIALKSLNSFHYNNDLWFKMRIALVEEHLGNFEESETLFKELLSSKAGSDKWFLYRDIAEVYYEHDNYNKAWKYAVDAAYYGNEPHFLIGLYQLQARILFKLNRADEGKLLAELISSILKEQGWRDKTEYNRLFDYYNIDRENTTSTKAIMEEARRFWNSERYSGKEKKLGFVISIHKNGKIGRIKESSGRVLGFHKKDLVKRMRSLDELMKAKVEFYEMLSEDGTPHAENITILQKATTAKSFRNDLIGKTVEGTIKKIAEFGIFLKIQGAPDGLLHKSNMPKHISASFQTAFKQDDKLNVIVEAITDKGLKLKLGSKY